MNGRDFKEELADTMLDMFEEEDEKDFMRCCVRLYPHGYLVLGLVTEFHAASC